MKHHYTAVVQKSGRWYVAWLKEMPGVNTQGRTLVEIEENLKEALDLILEENRKIEVLR
jgi:predicted RNase H-like HicB family nuclease